MINNINKKITYYTFALKYILFQILLNPFGLLILYFLYNIILQKLAYYSLIVNDIIKIIEDIDKNPSQEESIISQEKIVIPSEGKNIVIKNEEKNVAIIKTEPEELDWFTKKEIERIVQERAISDIVRLEVEVFFAELEMEYYAEDEEIIPQIVKPNTIHINDAWDFDSRTIQQIITDFGKTRVSATYNNDVQILMHFVINNMPGNLLGQDIERLHLYLSIFYDIIKLLPKDMWQEAYHEFTYYKISILTYNDCLIDGTLDNTAAINEKFEYYKQLSGK